MHEFAGLRGLRDSPEGSSCNSVFDCESDLVCEDGICKEDDFFDDTIKKAAIFFGIFIGIACIVLCIWTCYRMETRNSECINDESRG